LVLSIVVVYWWCFKTLFIVVGFLCRSLRCWLFSVVLNCCFVWVLVLSKYVHAFIHVSNDVEFIKVNDVEKCFQWHNSNLKKSFFWMFTIKTLIDLNLSKSQIHSFPWSHGRCKQTGLPSWVSKSLGTTFYLEIYFSHLQKISHVPWNYQTNPLSF
jgi:hypothetical protein